MNSKRERIEKIVNRILINFGIGIVAYILLWFLLSKLAMDNAPVFSLAAFFAAAAVVFYVLSAKKGLPLKNYAHMFVAFSCALLFTKAAVIVSSVVGINRFVSLLNQKFLKVAFNTTYEVKFIAILGALYLIAMLIYNCVLIARISNEKPNKKKK
ncbi:MAG: hypothetical protein N2171_04590 [Clostridia bacterium]|nr:hypothetical protein [Clostridia bacterium]